MAGRDALGHDRPIIAIATGDPAGIGPEISLKAALDQTVRESCRPVLVGDPTVIERHAKACGLAAAFGITEQLVRSDWSNGRVPLLACYSNEASDIAFGS